MTPKTTKPLLVLLDANVIIQLHRLGIWSQILTQCQVFATRCIVFDESKFYSTKRGVQVPINLSECIDNGSLTVLEANLEDLESLRAIFTDEYLYAVHDGEREALALISNGKHQDCKFCTSDGPAIRALAMMGKQQFGISLEELLVQNGFTQQVNSIPHFCTKRWFCLRVTEGNFNLVSGEGLR